MKERQFVRNGEMVRAILDGRKTQARFICKEANDGGSMIQKWLAEKAAEYEELKDAS